MRLFILHIVLLSATFIFGQQTSVSSTIDKDSILIGEQITLRLSTKGTANDNIHFPELNDTLSREIEIVEKSKLHKSKTDGVYEQDQSIIITAFDSGSFKIPAFPFLINDDTVLSEPLLVYVNTIAIDTALGYKPINDILSIPEPKRPFDYAQLWWLLLLLPVIIGLVLYFYFKNKKKKEVVAPVVIVPADQIALEHLSALEEKKLWQAGKQKAYHSELSLIIRQYLSSRYKIQALEQTSGELINMLKNSRITRSSNIEKIEQVLYLADNVKFAKYVPIEHEHNLSLANIRLFIQETKESENVER